MNRKTKPILTAAVVLVSVTVLSFGVRHVRVILNRARNVEDPVSNSVGPEKYSANEAAASARNTQQPEHVDIPLQEDQQTIDSEAGDAMTDAEEAFVEAKEQDDPREDERQYAAKKHWAKFAAVVDKKYSKKIGDYNKKVEYVPMKLSDTETLYTGKTGDYWLVQELPNGEVTKMQMQEVDGELQPAGEAETYSGDGGKGGSGGNEGK